MELIMERYFNSIKTFELHSQYNVNIIQKKRLSIKNLGVVYVDIQKPKIPMNYISYDSENFSYYKSLLQKSVRRQCTKEALWSCKIMLKYSIIQTIRRILIIMVEDVVCFEKEFLELVWLTCQTEFSSLQCGWILGLVKMLCEYPNKGNIIGCKTIELDIGIKLRKIYGGMKCDMNMLDNISSSVYNENEIILIKLSDVEDLTTIEKRQPFLAAMDFHISNIHLRVSKRFNMDENKVKDIIWKNRSSINSRGGNKKLIGYENIEKYIDEESWKIIQYRYKVKLNKNIYLE